MQYFSFKNTCCAHILQVKDKNIVQVKDKKNDLMEKFINYGTTVTKCIPT